MLRKLYCQPIDLIVNHRRGEIFYRYSNETCETLRKTAYSLKNPFIELENMWTFP